ncbi:MAG: glycoside hydrolase family 88 protein [Chloroflexota bacterium]
MSQDGPGSLDARVRALADTSYEWRLDALGVTADGAPIPALLHREAYSARAARIRALLVSGLPGSPRESVALAEHAARWYSASDERSDNVALSVAPCICAQSEETASGPDRAFPPGAGYFHDNPQPEARYLWRWICFQAPDIVLNVEVGSPTAWQVNGAASHLQGPLSASGDAEDGSLLFALAEGHAGGVGPVPCLRLRLADADALEEELQRLWSLLARLRHTAPDLRRSPARLELNRRTERTPMATARVLAARYGRHLDAPVVYTQGAGVSARLRLAALDEADRTDMVQESVNLVEPYVSGESELYSGDPEGPGLAALAWCEELHDLTGDIRCLDLLAQAAELYRPASNGVPPPPADPDFRTEDMFFTAVVLGRAFKLTGRTEHADLLARYLVDASAERAADGLFPHSRRSPWNWGRSNGFAALGFSEALSYLPSGHRLRGRLVEAHQGHVDALMSLQHQSGMWLQVLDHTGAYHELSATCMIGSALARGIRLGWLDATHQGGLERAWAAANQRIDDSANLVDVCAGTGVQASLLDYLKRQAVSGHDDRGGSMALWFAVEMERLRRARA